MENRQNAAEVVSSAKSKTAEFMKSKMFDLIAVAIVVAMLALSLGVFELREINLRELANIGLETLPFYFATIMLNDNYYMKGTYAGKATKAFKAIVLAYSNLVNSLTGKQIKMLPTFCDEYNQRTLFKMQENILRTEAITIADFNEDYIENDVHHGPLKALSKNELVSLLGVERAEAVIKAKEVEIKGINSNILLGSTDNSDITDLGPNEKEMHNKRKKSYAIWSFLSIFALTLIAVRDVTSWGWVGITLIVFKLLYIVAKAYMKYFEGYQDITISLANNISRKTDIIKEFEFEYPDKGMEKKAPENGHNH